MSSALLQMIGRDQAARAVDPALLTEREKTAKIVALQSRVEEMESIATFLATLVTGVERETRGAGADDRAYRTSILALCAQLGRVAIPVTIVDPVTGADAIIRRAL